MPARRRKPRSSSHDLTARYRAGDFDSARAQAQADAQTDSAMDQVQNPSQRFTARNKNAQQNKMVRTAELRAAEHTPPADDAALLLGQVTQVYSLFIQVEHAGQIFLCVVRKTMNKLSDTQLVVGDRVRFRDTGIQNETGQHEAVIEHVLPRDTVLTRADSFKQIVAHPIVANAQQMLIVASLKFPNVKWGLVDRMIVAARSGGLLPILCLNKIDLIPPPGGDADSATDPVDYYTSLGVQTLRTSAEQKIGLDELREALIDRTTVLAGHSGVGKSSLIRAIQPHLDIRVGAISNFNDKGRHTTSSARRYPLDFGGVVIDTPGVKLFGLWGVTRENLPDFFPDVANGTAPPWRLESYQRIAASLPK